MHCGIDGSLLVKNIKNSFTQTLSTYVIQLCTYVHMSIKEPFHNTILS